MTTERLYITKYALTRGIQYQECIMCGDDTVQFLDSCWTYYHGEGREWHRTYESALAQAEKMRDAHIKSLNKSLAKAQKQKFTDPRSK